MPPENAPTPAHDELRRRIEAHLSAATAGPVTVSRLVPLPGGACNENYIVEAAFTAGELAGPRRLVLRSDAPTSLPGSLDRAREHAVVCAAVEAGVRTPRARFLGRGLVREGAFAYFLDWVEGETIGRRVTTLPKLAAARALLPSQLAAEAAKIHSITPRTHPDLFGDAREAPDDPVGSTLDLLRGMLDRLGEPRPALELAMRWLDENRPPRGEVVLAHGDFRTGNFMVRDDGLAAVLDWEFARFSAPEEDLAWISVRDWRFGQLALPIGGFARREPFYEAYEKASGRTLSRAAVHYWEVLGNARWAAGSLHQGERYLAGDQDVELIAIARRAVEMEWETLRLIEKGA